MIYSYFYPGKQVAAVISNEPVTGSDLEQVWREVTWYIQVDAQATRIACVTGNAGRALKVGTDLRPRRHGVQEGSEPRQIKKVYDSGHVVFLRQFVEDVEEPIVGDFWTARGNSRRARACSGGRRPCSRDGPGHPRPSRPAAPQY